MRERIHGFLDNDSFFGRIMTRIGIIIGANLMFILFSMPIVTAGAAYTAMYHVMFKTLRGDGVINPFYEFWRGFRSNFKQSTLYWVAILALTAFGYVDVRFCSHMGGIWTYFQYAIYGLGLIALILTLYMFPVMSAFENTISGLLKSAFYFSVHDLRKLAVILFFNVFPMVLTYMDPQYLPLYAFCWCTFGFGAVVMVGAKLLLPDFQPYLEPQDNVRKEKSEKELLAEMKKLDL